jgi:hypothetical protein
MKAERRGNEVPHSSERHAVRNIMTKSRFAYACSHDADHTLDHDMIALCFQACVQMVSLCVSIQTLVHPSVLGTYLQLHARGDIYMRRHAHLWSACAPVIVQTCEVHLSLSKRSHFRQCTSSSEDTSADGHSYTVTDMQSACIVYVRHMSVS